MLLGGLRKEEITITTPKGIDFNAKIEDIRISENSVSCSVIKDGGDDPDVTTGLFITATVSLCGNEEDASPVILIDGGEGVGRVTKPGLDQPVGNAAINSVPRSMIEKEVGEVMSLFDCRQSLRVVISAPGGEEVALKTFNPRLGIEGGISILGTSGIVEPMSTKALLDTIKVELNQKKALGFEKIVIAPGNYGLDFMKENFEYNLDEAVKCSNYIGDTLDMIAENGFTDVLLCGHIGKLIKVSGGIMNTHSKEADCRMELMAAAAARAGAENELLCDILDCVSTDAAYVLVKERGLEKKMMDVVMEKIDFYLKKKAGDRFRIECIVISNENGLLGTTQGALKMLGEIKGEK